MSVRRGGERGLSIIEAIVIATITALLALLILPLVPRSAGSISVAQRGVDGLNAMRAEREFRTLVRSVSQRELGGEPQTVLEGDAAHVTLRANLPAAIACARAGAPAVRLAIRGEALFCDSEQRRQSLLRWPRDSVGALSYSADGASWVSGWSNASAAPYVRFELRRTDRVTLSWVERVSGEPS